jgi:hypothetical protein
MNKNQGNNRDVQEVVKNYELEIKMVRDMERARMIPVKKSLYSGGNKKRKLAEV